MGTLANSEDPGSALFAKIKTIFRDRNTSFYRNFLTDFPLKYKMDNPILFVSIFM